MPEPSESHQDEELPVWKVLAWRVGEDMDELDAIVLQVRTAAGELALQIERRTAIEIAQALLANTSVTQQSEKLASAYHRSLSYRSAGPPPIALPEVLARLLLHAGEPLPRAAWCRLLNR